MKILDIVFNGPEGHGDTITEDNPKIIADLSGECIFGSLPWTKDLGLLKASFLETAYSG